MQVTILDQDELTHTVPGFDSGMPESNPERTKSEKTYATYARIQQEMIQDVYGKWVPMRPRYATLDGLPVDEWNARPKSEG